MSTTDHDVRVREVLEAVQWWPGQEHPAVAISVLQSGIDRDLHSEFAHRLHLANGQLGIIRIADWPGWAIVEPGDWLVKRHHWELVKQAEFSERFVPEP